MQLCIQATLACLASAGFSRPPHDDNPAFSWKASRTLDPVALSAMQSGRRDSSMMSGRRRWHIDISLPQVATREAPAEAATTATTPGEGAPAEATTFSAPREGALEEPPAAAPTAVVSPEVASPGVPMPAVATGPSQEAKDAQIAAKAASAAAAQAVVAAAAAAKTPSVEAKIASSAASAAASAAVTATQTAEAAMRIAKEANDKLDALHNVLKSAAAAHSKELSDVKVNPPLIPRIIPMAPSPAASPSPAAMR
eukprot:gnl/MRDRNA2_/MRDRNA2_144426_c0_seq1.p1 gnl/MRDRNA2_/MRDRNA2_144426_c0~~gnl/MRDRNA2_/MRDRNA2_144426_c0_seq1.p1  ORF type:complete len:254 (+),score=63.95 gnl/MRDRNA2_/MRDRNA2_144426_c0_seq1:53-814(+)